MDRRNHSRPRPQLEVLEDRSLPSSLHGAAVPPQQGAAAVAASVATNNSPTVRLSLDDFLKNQGTTSIFNTTVPGLPDAVGWATGSTVADGRFALVDYAGKDAAFLLANFGIDLGTTVSGNITERPLSDGRALVTVNLFTKNALAWASKLEGDLNKDAPLLFGYRAQDLIANPGLKPALADSHLQVVFIAPAPGAPLPDLVDAFILGNAPAGVELVSFSFRATAAGVVHDPTGQQPDQQGRLVVSQTEILRGANDATKHDFGFTAEVIDILSNNR